MDKKINSNIKVFEHSDYVILYNTITKTTYKIGKTEYRILQCCCNSKSENESSLFDNEKVRSLVNNFERNHILVDEDFSEKPRKSIVAQLVKVSIDTVHVVRPHKFALLILYLCVPVLLFCMFFVVNHAAFYIDFFASYNPSELFSAIMLVISVFIATALHELWHMLVAHNEEADIPEAGVKCFMVFFWAFVKIIGIESLSRKSRLRIYFAGIASNIFWGCVFLVLMFLTAPRILLVKILFSLALANAILVIPNLLFIFKLDGNYIISELFGNENINAEALNLLRFKGCETNGILNTIVLIIYILACTMILCSIVTAALYTCLM